MGEQQNPDDQLQSHFDVRSDLLPDPYCLLNESGDVVFMNEAGRDMLRLEENEIIGTSLTNILDSESEARFQTRFSEIIAGDHVLDLPLTIKNTDEESVITSCSINPEFNDNNRFVRAHCIFRDITAQKQQESELLRFRSMLDQSHDAILIIDPDAFEIVDANETICDWLGYTHEEILSLHPWEIEMTMSDPDLWPKGLERLREIRSMKKEGINRRKDGSTFPVEVRLSLVSVEQDYIVSQIRDITERREREEELEAATQQIKESNVKLNQFADVVSHDLRNPLNVAEGRLDLAKQECDSEHLDVVSRALDRMGALITDILTLAREGKTVETTEWVDFELLVESCWDVVESSDATLETDITGRIRADRSRLQQLFENLMRNAIEHGGSDVTIAIGTFDNGFYVSDDGPGIPDPDREQIFEHGFTTTREGTGFGLSIVQEIAHAHGWEISAENSQDGGAYFEVVGVEIDQ